MLGDYGVYYQGRFYGFDTKEKMEEFIKRVEEEMQSGERKKIHGKISILKGVNLNERNN